MPHILDNPIWNALTTRNKHLALGSGDVKYIQRDVGLFAGFRSNSKRLLTELHEILPPKSKVILFTPTEITIPAEWSVKVKRPILQMMLQKKQELETGRENIVVLKDKHIPAMLRLTKMTNPGPFFSKTILFGNYEGIFHRNKLVSMIGQRLQAGIYTEVSAVCTHPDHTGKGYAAALLADQLSKITAAGQVPFLHVYPENTAAVNLYKKLGFRIRKKMFVYFIQKKR